MKPLRLEEISRAVHGRRIGGDGQARTVSAVCTDTRQLTPGELFVALVGQRFDGHNFLQAAAAGGCVAAIVQKGSIDEHTAAMFPGGFIAVGNSVQAMGDLAAWHRRQVAADVVAVTGSNGKTTVKRMIDHILSKHLKGTCSPKSFNNDIGVPLTLLGVGEQDDYVVCELGSNAPGEIATLGRLAAPDVAVITSVAATHLERLGSVEQVAAEKASLLGCLEEDGVGVVFDDSRLLRRAMMPYRCETILFGASAGADVRLTDYVGHPGGQEFEINGHLRVRMNVPGRHNATNALGAVAAAGVLGVGLADAAEAMNGFAGVEMRLEPIDIGEITILNDAYNANPGSVLAGADVLAERTGRRRVMIVGDMLELGASADVQHQQTGRDLAARPLELIIGVGSLGRHVARGAAQAGAEARAFDSVEDLVDRLGELLAPGDVVLIKASRGVALERLVEPIRELFEPEAACAGKGAAR